MANMQHKDFKLIRTQSIDALHVTAEEYEHLGTGARHLHFATTNTENVFLVGLKTVPTDNSGVAHILEHTALCGSEKYPVRDPFFMMIRRSLNTFMNAFTSSDWTAYPFASKNKKDFNNLLEVYLDAVFFSRLDEMDFLQEGHRLEFEKADDANSDLSYKGVVYNEMKGAMSSPVSQLWQTLTRHLYPTTTYHFNSGGDPEHITGLSYDDLKGFYKKHYHPSNAVFLTFGDIPAYEHHCHFQGYALSRFSKEDHRIRINDEQRYCAPIRIQENYPVEKDEPTEHKTHIVVSWLLGYSFDLEQNLEAHLLADVLFENSAAPLQRALEASKLGHAPSPLCGLEDSNREMAFACGLEGSEPGKEEELEAEIFAVLEKVAQEGVAKERLDAVLHQLELSQREIAGDSYPYGLQLILGALPSMLHGGDPVALLDLEPVIEKLRERVKDPEYFKSLVKKHLLDNSHRVTLSLRPDTSYDEVRTALLTKQLAEIKQNLNEEEKQKVIDQAEALKQRQIMKDDESILPKVGIPDVPLHLHFPKGEPAKVSDNITCYHQGTNGLVYQQIIIDMPELSEDLQALLPIYTAVVTALGAGESSYLEMQNKQSALTGGLGAYSSVKGEIDDVQDIKGVLVFSGKALSRNYVALTEMLKETLDNVRFDEHERLRELVAQMRARREQGVTSSGHALAMGVASSRMSPGSYLAYQLGGMQGIKALKALDESLSTESGDIDSKALSSLAEGLERIHKAVLAQPRQFLLVSESEVSDEIAGFIHQSYKDFEPAANSHFSLTERRETVKEAWLTSTQVNFCAKAYPTVAVGHDDAPALSVLGGFLRNGYLHRTIREQGGAYGGGAGQDSGSASFRFFSYRDPRLSETLDDFDASLDWLHIEEHDGEELEQAILGVVSQIDKPRSPAGEAKGDYHNLLFGRTQEHREAFRAKVLSVTIDDLQRVAKTYLQPGLASVAVISQQSQRDALEGLGLEIKEL
ncbi:MULTISPECIES: insulinase family protein [unclassified Oleiphilus]|nr:MULTISPECIES: insulinase family protein [unclassified Oleiphilus]KZY49695.1 peptidase M16 [Oleiphilus sp. HI0050]KZZ34382.1 peptidase M16 [Oleiphilus sp. HI0117]KZZ61894.1 peptidase M16 [Oleiphilus sp. HI0123]